MNKFKLGMFLLFAFAIPSLAQQTVFTGQVTDVETGKGLAYVHVMVHGQGTKVTEVINALTDTDGSYRFTRLTPGNYVLSVSLLGYYPQEKAVNLGEASGKSLNFEMKPALIPLGEVQVSSLRYNKQEKNVALPITVVPREYFPRQSAMTISDVLSREPGIALFRDGGWGTSINIRGLGENRLVSLVDGNRIETANDLAAGLAMFDVNEIDRIEVIKGAASSIYGTGAMGGVVNILTQKGQFFDKNTIHGSATGIFEGVNKLFGTHVAVESGAKVWKFRVSGGYRTAGDYKTPDGVMTNSEFNDRNVNATLGLRPFKNHEFEINAQHYQALDAGIPGGAPFGSSAKATYPEEKRQLVSARYSIVNLMPALNELNLRVYHQYILRDVEIIPNTSPVMIGNSRLTVEKITPEGKHNTTGAVLETKWKTGEKHLLVAGLDVWQRKLDTNREKFIRQEILDAFQMVQKTMQVVRSEKPNPDSRFGSAGIFVQQESRLLNDKLELTYGARLDRIRVANDMAVDPVGIVIDGVAKDPVPNQRVVFGADTIGAWSWSANVSGLYHLVHGFDLTLNAGRSFRSPSLEERFKYIDLGAKVRLGDPDLKPEKGIFGDLGLRIWHDHLQVQLNGYVHYLTDMIVETPGNFVYLLATGPDAGITDTLPALINANVDRALLAGFDGSINIQPIKNVVMFGKASYVRGINLEEKGNLPLIPPFSSTAGFRYQLPGIFALEWTTSWIATQRKIAAGETETEGYFLSDFSIYSSPRELGITSVQIFAGVDNVFNKSYRNHLATNRGLILAEPGRNIFLKLILRF